MEGTEIVGLVRRAASGDRAAQSALTVRFAGVARRAAARLVNDSHEVDDVVQEAFIEVFATLGQLREPEALPAWLRLSVRKQAERHRRRQRPAEALTDDVALGGPTVDELVERSTLVDHVRGVLEAAPNLDRRILELRYLADWTISDLAAALNITEGATRKRLHDARHRLRPALTNLCEREELKVTDYERLLGRVYRPGEINVESVVPPVARPAERVPISTGLKILDTIAPIARGGTVEMVGPAGTGHLVLVVEVSYRLNRNHSDAAIVAVASSQQSVGARSNLAKLVTELPEHDRHAVILSEDDQGARRALADGDLLARGLANTGVDVLLVVDKATATAVGGSARLKDLAGLAPGGGSVTLILLDPYARDGELPADAGMDTRLVFSADHLALGIFPALDPVESRANFDDSEIANEVRELLRTSNAVRHYFDQPMVVAETHTGETPTWVDRQTAEAELRSLVDART